MPVQKSMNYDHIPCRLRVCVLAQHPSPDHLHKWHCCEVPAWIFLNTLILISDLPPPHFLMDYHILTGQPEHPTYAATLRSYAAFCRLPDLPEVQSYPEQILNILVFEGNRGMLLPEGQRVAICGFGSRQNPDSETHFCMALGKSLGTLTSVSHISHRNMAR